MYIAQAFKGLHELWRYVVGLIIAIAGVFVFSIPHGVAIMFKTMQSGSIDPSKMNDPAYIMQLFESNINLVFILLPFAGGLLFLLGAVKWLHKQSFTSLTTARPKIDWKRFWVIFFFWGILSSSLVLIDYYMSPEDYVFNFKLQPFLILSIIAILLVPLQTSFEEYLFRGYLMQGIGVSSVHRYFPFVFIFSLLGIFGYLFLSSYFDLLLWETSLYFIGYGGFMLYFLNSKIAEKVSESEGYLKLYSGLKRNFTPLIITSVVFGLLHIANPEVDKLGPIIMVYYIGTGLFLGIMTLMDEGLELSLGFHAANNLFTALLVTADWTAFQTHSIFKDLSDPQAAEFMDIFMPVFVMFPIMLFILSRVYKWTDWKGKLFGKVIELPKEDDKVLQEINEIGRV
ncbi:CPBP family intramembrane glutamic endopeptidase [Gelidibacter sp.]|uniref:CPBP family intramembrane glutamic endopeptidase n=1 Tax=Gelidibacter sp. TaxID=2018083 RepID=UPI002D143B19|nr:CPBP family intramembrane glutamic endopeptidase [Gelidibacter sp.]HUH26767.1 CPBP family intramembrane glutamic endopeptidase [Gelidibacter sp.]